MPRILSWGREKQKCKIKQYAMSDREIFLKTPRLFNTLCTLWREVFFLLEDSTVGRHQRLFSYRHSLRKDLAPYIIPYPLIRIITAGGRWKTGRYRMFDHRWNYYEGQFRWGRIERSLFFLNPLIVLADGIENILWQLFPIYFENAVQFLSLPSQKRIAFNEY